MLLGVSCILDGLETRIRCLGKSGTGAALRSMPSGVLSREMTLAYIPQSTTIFSVTMLPNFHPQEPLRTLRAGPTEPHPSSLPPSGRMVLPTDGAKGPPKWAVCVSVGWGKGQEPGQRVLVMGGGKEVS